MLVLVTGATGFVARRVVRSLLAENHAVRCFVRDPGREEILDTLNVDVYYGSVLDMSALRVAVNDVDVVIHLEAATERDGSYFHVVNMQGTENVVVCASQAGVKKVIYLSARGARLGPDLTYFNSMWLAEQSIVQSGLPYVVLRCSGIFGEGDEFTGALAALSKISPVIPIPGSGNRKFEPIYVDDIARCIVISATATGFESSIQEVGDGQILSYNQLVDILTDALNVRRFRIHLPFGSFWWVMRLAGRIFSHSPIGGGRLKVLEVSTDHAVGLPPEIFPFTPRTLESGVGFLRDMRFKCALKTFMGHERFPPRESM